MTELDSLATATTSLKLQRRPERFFPEHRRVITRLFLPGGEERIQHVINRVLNASEASVTEKLEEVLREFEHRHRRFRQNLEQNYRSICHHIPRDKVDTLSDNRRLLIGACFTHEYSVSAAAMFNPSIIAAPDQTGLPDGSLRIIVSFRATGEGHISSIEFREGIIDKEGAIVFEEISPFLELPTILHDHHYEKPLFTRKLREIGLAEEIFNNFFKKLPDRFTLAHLSERIQESYKDFTLPEGLIEDGMRTIRWLAESNYTIRFPADLPVSERVLFPVSESERQGIEDARFVRFIDEDERVTYVATYTAYNGIRILPQIIETEDFITFKISTLNGAAVQNKDMALFPRKLGGRYVMLGRQDGENNFIMFSDNLHFWNEKIWLSGPMFPWEFIQVGNNGSPIKTSEGWLVITHGVGPMRKYCLGALLLDSDNPQIIRGRTTLPLLSPNTEERDGYVPNVVYTCGIIEHNGYLLIPYAMSDTISGFATVKTSALLQGLLQGNL